MKLTIIPAILLVASAVSSLPSGNHGELGRFLGELNNVFKNAFVGSFQIRNDEPLVENLLHSLFPNLTSIDPYPLVDNTTEYDSILVTGHHTITDNVMTGFSGITDALWLDVPAGVVNATFRVDLPSLHIGGGYDSELSFLGNVVHFSGSGNHNFNLENLFVLLRVEILATETPSMEITHLLLDAGFDRLAFSFENSELNGSPADWDEINQEIQIIADTYWPVIQDRVVPTLQGLINEVIKDCNINDLLEGNFECIIGEEQPDPIPELLRGLAESVPVELLSAMSTRNACPEV